jgi:hypothetical protein
MLWATPGPDGHIANSGGGGVCLDATTISRAQEAVERAWTRIHARENARKNVRIDARKNVRIYIYAINTSRRYVRNYVRNYVRLVLKGGDHSKKVIMMHFRCE